MSTIWYTNREGIAARKEPALQQFQKAYQFMRKWFDGSQQFVLQTSGSTGVPKNIVVSRQQLEASARMTGAALAIGQGTKALVCLNTDYIGGLMMLVRGMELHWELSIVPASSNPLLDVPVGCSFDFVAMVPLQLEQILDNPATRQQLDEIGTILLGGAPVSESLIEKIADISTSVFQSYGMTETVSHIALRRLNPIPETAYTVLPGVAVGTDERGCLRVVGAVTDGNLIQCNDLVRMVAPNQFEWLGRADHVINSGGVKIVLDQVDRQIGPLLGAAGMNAPFFAWFEPDDRLGQKLVLFLAEKGSTLEETNLLNGFKKVMKRYEVPKRIYFVTAFAKTATDKIDKAKTAQLYLNNTHDYRS